MFSVSPMIRSVVNSPGFINFISDPAKAVAIETGFKATCRPAFTLADKKADINARKYSATKEFIYQSLCLGLYLSVIPKFKQLGFWLGKKILGSKASTGFNNFKDYKSVKEFMKAGNCLMKKFPIVNGAIVFGTMVGSVIALTVVAPQIAHAVLPSIMKLTGIKLDDKQKEELNSIYAAKLDVYECTDGKIISIPKNITYDHLQISPNKLKQNNK